MTLELQSTGPAHVGALELVTDVEPERPEQLWFDGEPAAVFQTAPREYTAVLVGEELRNAVAADLADTDGMHRR